MSGKNDAQPGLAPLTPSRVFRCAVTGGLAIKGSPLKTHHRVTWTVGKAIVYP